MVNSLTNFIIVQNSNVFKNRFQTNRNNNRGIHESEEFYAYAKARNRNEGLFTADQKLQGNSQIYTRQNPGKMLLNSKKKHSMMLV